MSEQSNSLAKTSLVMGILAIVFMESGILGLIFAIIGRAKAKAFAAIEGSLYGKAKVGNTLSTIALILNIIAIVTILIVIIVSAIIAANA